MTNSADPDQLASSDANLSGSTLCKDRVYPGSAGQELILKEPITTAADNIFKYFYFFFISLRK